MSYSQVLVTGGAGFIGSHLVHGLISAGFEVTVLDDLSTGRLENLGGHLKDEGFNLAKGDIRDRDVIDRGLQDTEAVFHLAAITSVPYSIQYPKETYNVNVDGTRSLLQACLRGRVERVIYFSSCAVYGEPEYLPIDERHPLKPISPYAESKAKAEEVCTEFRDSSGLKVTVLRPFNVYGPRQRNDQYSGVIAKFLERLRTGKPPVIYGDGSQTRDFIHVADAVDVSILALRGNCAAGRTFNIATGVPTCINRLAEILIELSGAEGVRPQYASARRGDIRHSYGDISQAKLHLGFEPRVCLKEGLSTLF